MFYIKDIADLIYKHAWFDKQYDVYLLIINQILVTNKSSLLKLSFILGSFLILILSYLDLIHFCLGVCFISHYSLTVSLKLWYWGFKWNKILLLILSNHRPYLQVKDMSMKGKMFLKSMTMSQNFTFIV